MVEFLTTKDVASRVELLVRKAEKRIILISPFIRCWDSLFNRLIEAAKKDVEVIIVFGKQKMSISEYSRLQTIANVKLYYFENLHAKCYFNEKEMVLTSMNLYDFSEQNNFEMGVAVSKDDNVYTEAFKEAQTIKNLAVLKYDGAVSAKYQQKKNMTQKPASEDGYCIRCGKPIPKNSSKPFCFECYLRWNEYANREYEETFCHCCGKRKKGITIDKPLCLNCGY